MCTSNMYHLCKVVPQVVKAQLAVCDICHVAIVCLAALVILRPRNTLTLSNSAGPTTTKVLGSRNQHASRQMLVNGM